MRVLRRRIVLAVLSGLLMAACAAPASPSGGKPDGAATPTAASAKPTPASSPQAKPTTAPAQAKSAGTQIDACATLTLQDAEELFRAKAKNTYQLKPESKRPYETRCYYRTETAPDKGIGLYMQVDQKPADAQIGFDVRVSMATKKTESVSGLGDKAAYALEGVSGAGRAGAIYVLKGDVFFWITPMYGELAKEDAVKMAQKALSRLP